MEFNELIKAVDEALPQASSPELEETHKAHMVRLLEILLTNSYFTSDNKLYRKTIGASMGAIPSPGICDIPLCQFLKSLSENSPHKSKISTHAVSQKMGT